MSSSSTSRDHTRTKASFRGIFHASEDPAYWKKAMEPYPNRVPRFKEKKDAVSFMEAYCQHGSNPEEPHLRQSISTLTCWEQITKHLIPKIEEYQGKWKPRLVDYQRAPAAASSGHSEGGGGGPAVHAYLMSRLHLPLHQRLTRHSTLNTLRYLFNHMRCGIYVMIRNNEVVIFCPFVNKDYRNNWIKDALELDVPSGRMKDYYSSKEHHYRHENILQDTAQWWANGNIICNEHEQPMSGEEQSQYWGDHFLLQLKDMLCETCRLREIPDCDFFINKRDYPQLKVNDRHAYSATHMPVEPYGFIFNCDDRDATQDIPLSRELYRSYAPILSFYTSQRFADIPMPPSEDWESACGEIFPPSLHYTLDPNSAGGTKPIVGNPRDLFTAANLAKFDCKWEDKANTAFFRGGNNGSKCPLLDAKITGDRKKNFVEIYKQSHYKYLIYVEGHCAACRYGFMMQLGSVILKVDSQCVADQMWYFPLLKPYYDHVPVKADLSDLREQIEWCINNDDKCRQIAENAKLIYKKYVGKQGVLDYLQSICLEINQKTLFPPGWLPPVPVTVSPPPTCNNTGGLCCMPRCDDRCEHQLCGTCAVLMEKDRVEKAALREQAGAVVDIKKTRKELLAQRRRAQAAKAAAGAGAGAPTPAGASELPATKRQRSK
eukprot:GSChrysophyteH2.ASY1.ANO1.1208.1 assembled CDS